MHHYIRILLLEIEKEEIRYFKFLLIYCLSLIAWGIILDTLVFHNSTLIFIRLS